MIGLQKKDSGGIDKRIDDYFPDTSVPFHMRAKGYNLRGNWNPTTRRYDEDNTYYYCSVEVSFPQQLTPMPEKVLEEMTVKLMESSLGFGEAIDSKPFERPPIKTPKALKDIIDAFAGRPVKEKRQRKSKTTA